jgi:hypothetical protein
MTYQHPITPPPELVQQWTHGATEAGLVDEEIFAARAAQWGADQELEACVEWLRDTLGCAQGIPGCLRAARRPKPPSLAEEALRDIDLIRKNWVLLGGSDGTACPSLTGQVTLAQLDRLAAAAERLAQLEQQIIP